MFDLKRGIRSFEFLRIVRNFLILTSVEYNIGEAARDYCISKKYIYLVQKNVDGQFELIFPFLSVWRRRAALELSRGRRWRRWCRAVRSTRERPGCSRPPSQSTPRGYGACTPSVSTAPTTATPTRSRGGGRGCSIRGTRCPQTRQGRDLRVSSFLFFLPLLLRFFANIEEKRDRCIIIS